MHFYPISCLIVFRMLLAQNLYDFRMLRVRRTWKFNDRITGVYGNRLFNFSPSEFSGKTFESEWANSCAVEAAANDINLTFWAKNWQAFAGNWTACYKFQHWVIRAKEFDTGCVRGDFFVVICGNWTWSCKLHLIIILTRNFRISILQGILLTFIK